MGTLIIAAAPIGNIGDASDRLREAISSADFIAAEDSRRFARLCKDLAIDTSAPVISFFEGNERDRLAQLESALGEHERVLLITDSGMPGVSDPGYRAVALAIEKGFPIAVIPGPSAVTTALMLSGLPTDRFAFEGFSPRTDAAREKRLEELTSEERTMIFFEAPHRVISFLESAAKTWGAARRAAICREMTKTYEEVVRGTLSELLTWSKSKEMLGEFTIVIAGFVPSEVSYTDDEIEKRVLHFESAGYSRKEAIASAAKEIGVPKRTVFDIMVARK